ncbi:MAG: hypothetical protein PHH54_00110 [Candidatus Nanoarchaeia archaeon]|nr:hypothetical protein [Candidatus Nanoarchaeia archaeon]MDD5740365.1 hypothetical protein [Candidatus Nanoarchaeia archaeon]
MAKLDISNERWYITKENMFTASELEGKLPMPIMTTIVILHANWNKFSDFLRETIEPVQASFQNNPLSYKIAPYSESLPKKGEPPTDFFTRNIAKFNDKYLVNKYIKASELTQENPEEILNRFHYVFEPIYSGERIIDSDSRAEDTVDLGRKPIKNGHHRSRYHLRSYDISFCAGFNQDKEWFYSYTCNNLNNMSDYERLDRRIRTDLQEHVRFLSEKHDTCEKFGTKFIIMK